MKGRFQMRWTHKAAVAAGCAAILVTAACSSSSTGTAATSSTSAANAGSASAGSSSAPAPSAAGSASAPAGSMTAGSAPSASAPAGSAPAGSAPSASASAGAAPAGAALTKNPATDGKTINVLMVNNPQMIDLQKLTAANFTAKTGIKVNYTVQPENDMRAKASLEFKSQAGQYDVATLSNFEIPIYAGNNWMADLTDYTKKDTSFNQGDIFPALTSSLSVDGKVYGEPFYGESSFLMYRKDILAAKGVTLKDKPTWDEVSAAAAKVDGAQPGMKGICLRGLPGWGQLGAPLTTVVNTFGGTWWDKDWNAKVTDQPFKDAVKFYVDLVKAHGEVSPDQAGFTECLNDMQQSKVAMWYDATSAAGSLEASDSPVKGKVGYVQAPVKNTKSSGWLYAWSWAMENASKNKDAAWQFISWASSSAYENTVGQQLGWARVPAGKRTSLYSNPAYTKAAAAFAPATLTALSAADPKNPGTQPRPTVGIQFVDIPEFTAFGDKVTATLSQVLAGNGSVDSWAQDAQTQAESVGAAQK
jgi:sorbitol/mannitol transport system substrate-binding protein